MLNFPEKTAFVSKLLESSAFATPQGRRDTTIPNDTFDSIGEGDYFGEHGLDKAISKLAADYFAGKRMDEVAFKVRMEQVVGDILAGYNRISHEPINMGSLPTSVLTILTMSLERGIKEIAEEDRRQIPMARSSGIPFDFL